MAELGDNERSGILISLFSTASAVGKTFLAVNMAAVLAEQGFRVCVADLDMQFGDSAHFLGLEPEKTVYEAQEAVDRDILSFRAEDYLTPCRKGNTIFYVLAAPKTVEQAYTLSDRAVLRTVQELRKLFDYVLVDMTSVFSELNMSVMGVSTLVMAVVIVDFIPTVKNMKTGLDALKKTSFDTAKLRYILNRSNARTNIGRADVEKLVGAEFYHVLPNDYKTAVESIHSGLPVVLDPSRKNTALSRSVEELCGKLTNRGGAEEAAAPRQSRSWLSRLFKS